MLVLLAAAIYCALSEYTTGKMCTLRFSQDGYRGKFCPSMVIDYITAEAIALINYTWWGCFILPPPQWCCLAIIGAPQSLLALHSLDWRFDILFTAPYCLVCPCSSSRVGASESSPQSQLGVPLFYFQLFTSLPCQCCSAWVVCSTAYARLNPYWCSLGWICAPQFHSALVHHHQHSPCPPRTPHLVLLLSLWHTSVFPEFIIVPFKFHFDSLQPNLNSTLLDIPDEAKRL